MGDVIMGDVIMGDAILGIHGRRQYKQTSRLEEELRSPPHIFI